MSDRDPRPEWRSAFLNRVNTARKVAVMRDAKGPVTATRNTRSRAAAETSAVVAGMLRLVPTP